MTSKKLFAAALAGLLVLSSVAAAGVASSTAGDEVGNDLGVAVENVGNDGATVTVTQNESAVENASVTVEAVDENESYAGTGEYATDENGTVSLPEPEAHVTVEVTAAKGDATGSTVATLTADESDDGDEADEPFGQRVSSFVHEMLGAGDDGGPLGQMVSEFVTENNPGNADENRPDHAGPSDDRGNANDRGNATENGTHEDGERGPPGHAGPSDDDEADGGDSEEDDDDGGSQGPPDHAGNGNGNGN